MISSVLLLLAVGAPHDAVESSASNQGRSSRDARVVLYHGGTIHTWFPRGEGVDGIDDSAATASAMLVLDGRIFAVGDVRSVLATEQAKNAERIDLGGAHAYPGFQHVHGDLERYGAALEGLDLSGAASSEEALSAIEEYARTVPAGEWIIGHGLHEGAWTEGDAAHLDARASERISRHPMVLFRSCRSALLANDAAREAAGATDGEARGWVTFAAPDFRTLYGAMPRTTAELRRRRILRGQAALLERGYTCVHLMDVAPVDLAMFQTLRDEGALQIRVACYVDASSLDTARDFADIAQPEDPRDLFRVAGATLRVDGAILPRAAWLSEGYASGRALVRAAPAHLDRRALFAARVGLQPVFLATGDRAVRASLDAIERIGGAGLPLEVVRPRIEGIGIVARGDLPRFERLFAYPSAPAANATFGPADPERWESAPLVRALGRARAQRVRSWSGLEGAAGLALQIAPDAIGEGTHPFAVIAAAVRGLPPSSNGAGPALTVPRVLAALTAGAARATAQEDRRGRLARGFLCDLTVTDIDLTQSDAAVLDALAESQILMTVVNGRIVMDRR